MTTQDLPRPTDAELAILRVLWRHGSCTVREVRDHLASNREIGYTTILKLLQIMTQKGLVHRDESQRAHVYEAKVSEEDTQWKLLEHLLDQAFDSSASRLVLQALSSRAASPEELAEIRKLVIQLEKEGEKQ